MAYIAASLGDWEPDTDAASPLKFSYASMGQARVAEGVLDLITAENVWSVGGRYVPLGAPVAANAALPVTAVAAFAAAYGGNVYSIAGSGAALYYSADGGATWVSAGTGYTGAVWSFAQYGNCVYASNGVDAIQAMDLSVATPAFSPLSAAAPKAKLLGVVRDFLVAADITAGDQTGSFVLQWSALANPASWPPPATQDARASQSGAQSMYSSYGAITHVTDGEEMGVVFQESGISRMQYVGGDVVFNFYTFERKHGLAAPGAVAQVGNVVYFLSSDGFYATDGTTVKQISYGKIDNYFTAECSNRALVRAAADTAHTAVMFAYPTASGYAQLIYSISEDRWTHASHASPLLFQGRSGTAFAPYTFDAGSHLSAFTGVAGAYIDTKDVLLVPSSRTLVTGIRVLSDAPATVQLASRVHPTDTVMFDPAAPVEALSGIASTRGDGYFHRVRVGIGETASYLQAVGFQFTPRGAR